MSYPLLEIQQEIYAILNADATLQNLINGIYDQVPDDAVYPFIAIEDARAEQEGFVGGAVMKVRHQLVVYSRYHGKGEVHSILSRIHALLHNVELNVEGMSFLQMLVVQSQADGLSDARTQRGQMLVEVMGQV